MEQIAERLAAHHHQLVRQKIFAHRDQIGDLVHRRLVGGEKDVDRCTGADLSRENVRRSEDERHPAVVVCPDLAQRVLKARCSSDLQLVVTSTAGKQQHDQKPAHGLIQ